MQEKENAYNVWYAQVLKNKVNFERQISFTWIEHRRLGYSFQFIFESILVCLI